MPSATQNPTGIFPHEFAAQIHEAAKMLHEAPLVGPRVAQLRKQADSEVAAAHAAAYPLPLSVARLLYQHEPAAWRQEIMDSLANLHGKRMAEGLSASAVDAAKAGDGWLLGWLLLQMDLAACRTFDPVADYSRLMVAGGSVRQQAPKEDSRSALMSVLSRFLRLADELTHRPNATWANAVLGYLQSLGRSFSPPGDLCNLPWARNVQDLPLLRRLVSAPPRHWAMYARLLANLQATACLFAWQLVEPKLKVAADNRRAEPPADLAAEAPLKLQEDFFKEFVSPDDDPKQFQKPPPPPMVTRKRRSPPLARNWWQRARLVLLWNLRWFSGAGTGRGASIGKDAPQ